jgi:hypothetical protein
MTTKKPSIMRSKEEWLKIIDACKSSQKNVADWCKENDIPPSSFHTAFSRYCSGPITLQRYNFQELNDTIQPSSGIELTVKGVTLKISQKIDEDLLLQLLKILEKL